MRNKCNKCKYPYCCHYSMIIHSDNGKLYNIILKNQICKYLDKKSHKCLIYKNRLKVNPYCLTIEEGIRQYALPKECLYVKDNVEYKEKIPQIHELPDDITLADKLILENLENMSHRDFMKNFLPLIL